MARPKKDAPVNLAERHTLTVGLIERAACPADKDKVFLRDSEAPGLCVRVTAKGAKSFVFQTKTKERAFFSRTIGDVKLWTIEQARAEARRLAVALDSGQDPRETERQQQHQEQQRKAAAKAQAVTVGEVWQDYLQERAPFWGEHHRNDHARLSKGGGQTANRGTRGKGVTGNGPLYPLLALPLRDLTAPTIEAWAAKEGQHRPTAARLAWRLLRAFLTWCAEHEQYSAIVPHNNPAKTRKAREALGKASAKQDALLKEQLPGWFEAVRAIGNPVVSAYLQTTLLTGARPGEVLGLQWEDINTQWRGLTIRDKVEGERVIPLTPYVHQLLATLPRRNEYVFASNRKQGAAITEPNHAHDRACKVAGVPDLTLHGLRRSFKSLTEWLEVPTGVVAQIQGHKPSATAEKHYTVRPLDLLRIHHERIEAWILEQAGVQFDAKAEPGKLRAVS
ncbi:MAG: integrase family protein [Comamonas sp.]|nr:integrase family protein [Comamonas sp.]